MAFIRACEDLLARPFFVKYFDDAISAEHVDYVLLAGTIKFWN